MRISQDKGIALADLGNPGNPETESDTSAHSYRLEDVVVRAASPSPFAAAAQIPRISVATTASIPPAPQRMPSGSIGRPSEDFSTTGRVGRSNMRVSIDVPRDRNIENLDNALVQGRVVRRRRRLPINIVIFFGVVTVTCLVFAMATLSIGVYNLNKLRASRAAKTVSALSDDISPLIHALYNKLFHANTVEPP